MKALTEFEKGSIAVGLFAVSVMFVLIPSDWLGDALTFSSFLGFSWTVVSFYGTTLTKWWNSMANKLAGGNNGRKTGSSDGSTTGSDSSSDAA